MSDEASFNKRSHDESSGNTMSLIMQYNINYLWDLSNVFVFHSASIATPHFPTHRQQPHSSSHRMCLYIFKIVYPRLHFNLITSYTHLSS